MSNTEKTVAILQAREKALSEQFEIADVRAHRIITTKAAVSAPEGFFTRFDSAVLQGLSYVKQSGASTTQDAMSAVLTYVEHIDTTHVSKRVLSSLLCYALFGFDILEPFLQEQSVESIEVNTHGEITITVHQAPTVIRSLSFRDKKHVSGVINKMLSRAESKKKVNGTTIEAKLKNGIVFRVHQEESGFALHIVKKSAQKQPATADRTTEAQNTRQKAQKQRTQQRTASNSSSASDRPVQGDTGVHEDHAAQDEKWKIDPVSGKRYKALPGIDSEFMKSAKKGKAKSMSKEQLLKYVGEDPDFDGKNLNKSAEIFMAHLRGDSER